MHHTDITITITRITHPHMSTAPILRSIHRHPYFITAPRQISRRLDKQHTGNRRRRRIKINRRPIRLMDTNHSRCIIPLWTLNCRDSDSTILLLRYTIDNNHLFIQAQRLISDRHQISRLQTTKRPIKLKRIPITTIHRPTT